jgi:ABC-2 type transport system permease protein
MRQILTIVRHDLRQYFRDRKAFSMLFVVPIAIASFMGYLFGGKSGRAETSGVQVAIVDLDNSAISRQVITNFANDKNFRIQTTDEPSARSLVINGKLPAVIVLPKGLGDNVLPGLFDTNRRPVIRLLIDPSHEVDRQIVEGMLLPNVISAVARESFSPGKAREWLQTGMTQLVNAPRLGGRERQLLTESLSRVDTFLGERDGNTAAVSSNAASASREFKLPMPFRVDSQPLLNTAGGAYNGYAHSFAGMSIQFVLMAMIDLAVGLLTERTSGTFKRIRSIPLSRTTLLAGKGISYTLIAWFSMAGCFAFAILVFGVRIEGSWIGFAGCIAATGVFAAALALALAAVGGTAAATRGLAIPTTLLLLMVGGAWVPVFLFPSWLRQISLAAPTRWAIDGFDGMTWRGLELSAAIGPIAGLLAAAAALAALARWRFRWDAD